MQPSLTQFPNILPQKFIGKHEKYIFLLNSTQLGNNLIDFNFKAVSVDVCVLHIDAKEASDENLSGHRNQIIDGC